MSAFISPLSEWYVVFVVGLWAGGCILGFWFLWWITGLQMKSERRERERKRRSLER